MILLIIYNNTLYIFNIIFFAVFGKKLMMTVIIVYQK